MSVSCLELLVEVCKIALLMQKRPPGECYLVGFA